MSFWEFSQHTIGYGTPGFVIFEVAMVAIVSTFLEWILTTMKKFWFAQILELLAKGSMIGIAIDIFKNIFLGVLRLAGIAV